MIVEKAHAKINLYLDVVGVRDDGFHDIKTVMHSVGLCDELEFIIEESNATEIELFSDSDSVPTDRSNIVFRAAEEYLNRFGTCAKLNINIMKKIPVCAGLGGGSSDGAATLRALNRHFGFASREELLKIAAEIGSDIPFCVFGGAALCEGRGEIITPIAPLASSHTVIAIGKERISTPKAYGDIDKKYPDLTLRKNENDMILENILSYKADGAIPRTLYNIFEEVVCFSEIEDIKKTMLSNGAITTLMSGSGPSVFGFFGSYESASDAVRILKKAGYQAYYTTTISEI